MDSDSPVEMPKVEKMVHSQAMPGHWNGVGARFWCSHCMEETHTHTESIQQQHQNLLQPSMPFTTLSTLDTRCFGLGVLKKRWH